MDEGKTELLTKWYLRIARKLPWRESHDPYRIWVSEVMLQQTQVQTVIPYYLRFLKSFPTLKHLSRANETDVLAHWSGLGYYSRAKNLQKGARYLVDEKTGIFPTTREEMRAIPGIGPYTAGAILSIAFNLPEPIVDGNVKRVFARYYGVTQVIDQPKIEKFFWEKAEEWVKEAKSPRILNQALMELGALVCTKSSPNCDLCPLSKSCKAFSMGKADKIPRRKDRRAPVPIYFLVYVHLRQGKVFVRKNEQGWWKELWDLPREKKTKSEIEKSLRNFRGTAELLGAKKHTVTHHKITAYPLRLADLPKRIDGKWISFSNLNAVPLSSLSKKILADMVE